MNKLTWLCGLIILLIITLNVINNINFNNNCIGYLKRAADANSVALASNELQKSVNYIESNNLTTGYTSIFYKSPDEDIEFWYNNIKESQKELSKVSSSDPYETSNILMKLRETLMDGNELTYPEGLSRYPYNVPWAIINFIAVILVFFVIYKVMKTIVEW